MQGAVLSDRPGRRYNVKSNAMTATIQLGWGRRRRSDRRPQDTGKRPPMSRQARDSPHGGSPIFRMSKSRSSGHRPPIVGRTACTRPNVRANAISRSRLIFAMASFFLDVCQCALVACRLTKCHLVTSPVPSACRWPHGAGLCGTLRACAHTVSSMLSPLLNRLPTTRGTDKRPPAITVSVPWNRRLAPQVGGQDA
jgi:hypothetical protein